MRKTQKYKRKFKENCEKQILELLALDGSANIVVLYVFQNKGKKGAQRNQNFRVFCVINL